MKSFCRFLNRNLLLLIIFFQILSFSNFSYASEQSGGNQAGQGFEEALCNILKLFNGKIAKVIAAVAIIAVSFGAFTGKLQWTVVFLTVTGIIMMFTAGDIVNMIAPKGFDGQNCTNQEQK